MSKPIIKQIRNLVLYFLAFSYIGHLMEVIIMVIGRYVFGRGPEIVTHYYGVVGNPLDPFTIYGTAVVALVLLERFVMRGLWQKTWVNWKTWQKILVTFVICTLLCAALEFSASFFMTVAWGENPYWNYSGRPFNLMGHIYLVNTLFFGVVSTILVFLAPKMEKIVNKLPNWLVWLLIGLLGACFFINYVIIA